jgi:alkaline phosphatase
MKRAFVLFLIFVALGVRTDAVILVIGDGMGIEAMKRAQDGGYPWTGFPYFTALDTTNPACGVPDSASAATAIACGVFTENGRLGMDAQGRLVPSLAEEAIRRGMRVGLVTTDDLTGATPGAFYAHVTSRKSHRDIAGFLLKSRFDLFVGGGRSAFDRRQVKRAGYAWRIDLRKPLHPPAMALLADAELPSILQDPRAGRLLPLVQAALECLQKGPRDYFLIVENGEIDEGAHSNNPALLKAEARNLCETVRFLLEYARRRLRTVLLVTADHDTGGFDSLTGRFSCRSHTTRPVALLSTHPLPPEMGDQTDLHRYIRTHLLGTRP